MGLKTSSLSPQQGRALTLVVLEARARPGSPGWRGSGPEGIMRVDTGASVPPQPVPGASLQNDKSMEVREVTAGKAVSVRQPRGWPRCPCLPGEGAGPGGPSFSGVCQLSVIVLSKIIGCSDPTG